MNIFSMKLCTICTIAISMILFPQGYDAYGEGIPIFSRLRDLHTSGVDGNTDIELNTCSDQLTKYRRFLLQAIINFEDVCDAYNVRPTPTLPSTLISENIYHGLPIRNQDDEQRAFSVKFQPAEQRSEIWAFFKLLISQFDSEFTNIIRNAVIERCRIKSQLQRDEKRNSVVLGKKQRFHSWGGKRSQPTQDLGGNNNLETYIA